MPQVHTILFVLLLAGCSGIQTSADSWDTHTFDLSGNKFSFSVPKGQFEGSYLSSVDLSKNYRPYVGLFNRSWLFSGFPSDKGALELIVGVISLDPNHDEQSFLKAIQRRHSETYKAIRSQGIELKSISKRKIGNKEWICYSISGITNECAQKIDPRHYISWKLKEVDNSSSNIPARDELREKIEGTVNIQF